VAEDKHLHMKVPLFQACYKGDVARLKDFLATGAGSTLKTIPHMVPPHVLVEHDEGIAYDS
jgi:hypothetical protein